MSSHAPRKKTRKREIKFQSKPGITRALQKIKNKELFSQYIKRKNPNNLRDDYKNYRNTIQLS